MAEKQTFHFPKIGMRMIKTVIAVMICFTIDYFRDQSPFYSAIAAILCMQPDVKNSVRVAKNRTIGTLIGGTWAVVLIFLEQSTALEPLTLVYYLVTALFVIPLIYTTLLWDKRTASYITCVVFLSVTVSHISDGNPYLFAANRVLDTLIGIFVSLAVNKLLPNSQLSESSEPPKPLVHGGDVYSLEGVLDFSANINPLGLPDGVLDAVSNSISQCDQYPDPLCRELRSAISEKEEIPLEFIRCGNGAADLIFRSVWAVKPKKALVLAPSFAEYEQALSSAGVEIVRHILKDEEDYQVTDRVLEELTPEIEMAFFCNPNNPTGHVIEPSLLNRILEQCRKNGTVLVLDECFQDFLEEKDRYSLLDKIEDYPNLFILKAFTKIYAIPGLRLGYCFSSNSELLERLDRCGQPWSVSLPAQVAGVAALQEENTYCERTNALISREKMYLMENLENLGIRVVGSKANYLFFQVAGVHDLKERLLEKKIMVRSCGNYPGLDSSWYRAAIRQHGENERLISALQEVLM